MTSQTPAHPARLLLSILCLTACSTVPKRSTPVVAEKRAQPAEKVTLTPDQRIDYWKQRIAAAPTLYPAYAELSVACLDKARASHDPAWLTQAREAVRASVAIQETFEAARSMVAIENYSHRFESALEWARREADSSPVGPDDPAIVSAMVESYLGLGQLDEARKLLPRDGEEPRYFYVAAALGQWLNAANRHDEASQSFLHAAELARKEGVGALAAWATIAAAGALLDGHKPAAARPLLERAAAAGPPTVALRIHQAELAVAEHRLGDALARYEEALAMDPDPEVQRMAFVVAHQLGDAARMKLHFDAAERGFRRAIDAGEVYSLGALAQLYVDAGVHLDEARALSERNWKYKRDHAAQLTYAALHGGALPASAIP